jgi:hypothetical protein
MADEPPAYIQKMVNEAAEANPHISGYDLYWLLIKTNPKLTVNNSDKWIRECHIKYQQSKSGVVLMMVNRTSGRDMK